MNIALMCSIPGPGAEQGLSRKPSSIGRNFSLYSRRSSSKLRCLRSTGVDYTAHTVCCVH